MIGTVANPFTLNNTGTINANLSRWHYVGRPGDGDQYGYAGGDGIGNVDPSRYHHQYRRHDLSQHRRHGDALGRDDHDGTITNSASTIQQSGNISILAGSITLNGILTVVNNNLLELNAGMTLTNNGTLSLASAGNVTDLDFAPTGSAGTVTLNGTGSVSMSNNIANRIYSFGSSSTLVNNSTIQGAGVIGTVANPFTFKNTGTVNANLSNSMSLVAEAMTTNTGTLEATAGGTLILSGVAITNTGGLISAGTGSTVTLSGAAITDGTITNSGGTIQQLGNNSSLAGSMTLNGILTLVNNNLLELNAGLTLTNNGTLSVASGGNITDLVFAPTGTGGTVTLDGTGSISLSNNANNRIYSDGASSTLVNNSTIQGSGQIGAVVNPFTFTNGANGLILANQSTSLLIGGMATLTNNGTEQTASGSLLQVTGPFTNFSGTTLTGGTYDNAGTFQFPNANIVTNQATIIMNGSAR